MPRIPTYDQFTAQENVTPMPRMSSPDMPIVGGKSAEALGNGLMNAAAGLAEVADKAAQEADQVRVIDATNKAFTAKLNLTHAKGDDANDIPAGFLTLKGDAALRRPDGKPLDVEYTEKYQRVLDGISSSLSNKRQRNAFYQVSSQLLRQLQSEATSHMAAEYKDYQIQTYNGTIETQTNRMALDWGNTAALSEARGLIVNSINERDKDLPPQVRKANLVKALSPGNYAVVKEALNADNLDYAKNYFKNNIEYFNADARLDLESKLDTTSRDQKASNAVNEVWNTYGPKNDREAANLDNLSYRLRTQFADDPVTGKLATALLKERVAERDYSVKARESSTHGELWKSVIDNVPLARIKKLDAFSRLDYDSQGKFIEEVERFRKRNDGDKGSEKVGQFASYWAIASNPEGLAKMTDAEIFAKTPEIGLDLTKQLLAQKHKIGVSDDKVRNATIDKGQFDYWANQAGITDKAELGALNYRVETVIDQEQTRQKRELRRDEKEAIVKQLVLEVPLRVKNKILPGTTVENRRLYEVKDPRNIVIPNEDKQAVTKSLKADGITNPTEDQVRNRWLRAKALQGQ